MSYLVIKAHIPLAENQVAIPTIMIIGIKTRLTNHPALNSSLGITFFELHRYNQMIRTGRVNRFIEAIATIPNEKSSLPRNGPVMPTTHTVKKKMMAKRVLRIVGDNLKTVLIGQRIINVDAMSVVVAAPQRPKEKR